MALPLGSPQWNMKTKMVPVLAKVFKKGLSLPHTLSPSTAHEEGGKCVGHDRTRRQKKSGFLNHHVEESSPAARHSCLRMESKKIKFCHVKDYMCLYSPISPNAESEWHGQTCILDEPHISNMVFMMKKNIRLSFFCNTFCVITFQSARHIPSFPECQNLRQQKSVLFIDWLRGHLLQTSKTRAKSLPILFP